MEQKLRSEARALLEQGKVDCIIGFAPGSLKFATTPLITRSKEDIDRLVINPFITNNLSVYLTGFKGRAGIVAKGCDSRSIVSLIQDKQIAREDIVILGVPCSGVIDLNKVEQLAGRNRDEIDDVTREGDRVVIAASGEKKTFPIVQVLRDDCLACESPAPREYDILLGEKSSPPADKEQSLAKIKELEAMSPEKRWEFWKQEFSGCIRCYACRRACPSCFCERCFAEETEPQWVSPVPHWQDNLMFQVTRILHTAGRCVDCGECERACPANIPLRTLARKMHEIVGELFQYQAGTDKNAAPLMTAYQSNEAQDFIR